MRINPINYSSNNYNPHFGGRTEKLINTLQTTINIKPLKITTDEAVKVYEKLGYSVRTKPGSHMTITHPSGIEFALKIPHGSEKRFIGPESVKTLQCAVFEDLKQLVQSLHYHRG